MTTFKSLLLLCDVSVTQLILSKAEQMQFLWAVLGQNIESAAAFLELSKAGLSYISPLCYSTINKSLSLMHI